MAKLPGLGPRSARRAVLKMIKKQDTIMKPLANMIQEVAITAKECVNCGNIGDQNICNICTSDQRSTGELCVVEDVADLWAMERTQVFKGKYHVLGDVISPLDGIGPDDVTIDSLVEKVAQGKIKEIILALSTTMEGDTTNFYIFKRLKDYDVKMTVIARGISVGDELEYADELTLGRSIVNRTPYENSLA